MAETLAVAAAIRAGYSAKTAEQQGPRLLGNVGVKAAIEAARNVDAAPGIRAPAGRYDGCAGQWCRRHIGTRSDLLLDALPARAGSTAGQPLQGSERTRVAAAEQAQREADAQATASIDAARCLGRTLVAEAMPWPVLQRLAAIHAGSNGASLPDGHIQRAMWMQVDDATRQAIGQMTDREAEGLLAGVAEVCHVVLADGAG